jgi:hypothetical protein
MTTASRVVDGKYYQAAKPRSLGERLAIVARDRIYDDFMRLCASHPDDTILDVGVSEVVNDAANLLERKYPTPDRITTAGLSEGSRFKEAYPRTAYVRIVPGQPLPFADKSFAIATSNGALEHVGGRAGQLAFVSELARVARKIFIPVSNCLFPVEHHIAIPLLHYWDASFAFACASLHKGEWAEESNLILMSLQRLASMCPPALAGEIERTGIAIGPFSSNLFLFADAADARP